MFIYFPEFLYRKSKSYIKNIFESKNMTIKYEASLENLISQSQSDYENNNDIKNNKDFDEFRKFPLKDFKENLSTILKDDIDLPKVEFIACNKFKDFDILPISDYNFSQNKITICFDKLSSLPQGNKKIDSEKMKIKYFEALFLKEFSYFYEINKNFALKKISLNDKAKLSINACRSEIMHRYPIEQMDFRNKSENLFYDELIRRCAYNEFKYKFNDDIEFEASNSYDNINELTRKYINSNYI